VLDGDVLLDGRNRFAACEVAEVEPRFVQFAALGFDLPAYVFAFDRNLSRRHLTPDQRTLIVAEFFKFDRAEVERQKAEAGKQGGRGHKKNLATNSSQGSRRAPSTRVKVAEAAKVSEHKAQQAIDVVQRGTPELVASARNGRVKLSDAAHRVGIEQLMPTRDEGVPPAERAQPAIYTEAALRKLLHSINEWMTHAPPPMRARITSAINTHEGVRS
jgi:hypothetical protein